MWTVFHFSEEYQKSSQKSTQKISQKNSQKISQKNSLKIISLITENSYITTKEMADSLGITRRTVANHLRLLQEHKFIRRVGPDKGGHWEIVKEKE